MDATNLFDMAANMNRMQAAGYAAVREQERAKTIEEIATLLEGWDVPYAAIEAVRALKRPE